MNKKLAAFIVAPILLATITAGALVGGAKSVWNMTVSDFKLAIINGAPEYEYNQQPLTESTVTEGKLERGEVNLPAVNSQFGKISCEAIGLQAPLYYGDTEEVLEKGVGIYVGSSIPAEGKAILIGGHDTTFMEPLQNINVGDVIGIATTYGEFSYEVTHMEIADVMEGSAYDLSGDEERLILYTCYPFGKVSEERSKRYFVYAKKVAGPTMQEEQASEK